MTSMPPSRRASARFALAIAVLGLFAAQPALARKSDRQQEMQVAAKHFDGFQKPNSVSTLTGNVVITQGTLKATGAQAKVYFDADTQISRVVITGSPAHLEQLDDSGNLILGDAATLDYDNLKGIAVLSGNASVTQKGRGDARGDRLTYNTETSQMTGESAGDGLVHMTFKPKPQPAAAPVPATSSPTPQGQP
ncbi:MULTISPECIES: lipopolysaccharide transport periplasmic protein LptA [Rhodanobacter]|uniref:Lipopolysaccharide transport periplasmic protein LptA n=1 Tax=Rhodanobacter denitrificans TaxID=666685 RepID=M4NJC6_9GAMM|nr:MULTISPECIES: lipopolysaccharide transport periplasmic protein LptA [Rhodanobacter]AGG90207.1 lipopolysaccharide transport periplasmic protein LptA [Rhodanobacter denitrificans]KZC18750.1 sugar transporter [Rhodanobacter denitrificans]UJJ50303.1 lipopolysaccharide transport periplasmic protein LptA [Rhodanobacter denitrificans]UJJ57505.1 lipopolysaccharide transport periplasmic protein LptA [Rhodanobacter denitrificans]UJM85594.1 lipopolysaccharide transport periplasmic protein LptA [Rhodan